MDENLIDQTVEEYDVTDDIEITEIDVPVEDIEQEISVAETIQEVVVEQEEEVTIDLSESMGWVSGDNRYHDSLLGVDAPNQHPIAAITGLKAKLDNIESLKTVYSDKTNIANFYEWKDAAYAEYGYFVSLVQDSSTIQICEGDDVFGVSVEAAGFIGGQDASLPRDSRYGLIATSGLVDVKCELDVEVGDYVVSNRFGCAAKTTSYGGYKVLAKEKKDGIEYAVIMLGVQADTTDKISKELQRIDQRVDAAETNIAAAMNVANEAHKKADEIVESNVHVYDKVTDVIEKVDNIATDVGNIDVQVGNIATISAQAKAIAEGAATSAESMKNDAVKTANNALSKAEEIEKTVAPITQWQDPESGNIGATYYVEYIENGLLTKAEMKTVERLDEENKLLIEKNAESIRQMLSSVDKYSVGEYSQAYGLTLEQARNIMNDGMVYIPTKHGNIATHTETYSDSVTYYFTHTFYYVWTDGMWLEGVGEVWFGTKQPAGDAFAYWYDGTKLFMLKDGQWIEVATLAGNINNRITSMIRHDVDSITAEIVNAHGSVAGFGAWLSETNVGVQSLTSWSKDSNGSQYNLATIQQTANDAGANIAQVITSVGENGEVTASSIVHSINNGDSSVTIDADHIAFTADDYGVIADNINLSGYVTISDLQGENTTIINGSNITTGTITAKQIASKAITSDKIDAKAITSDKIDADAIKANHISAGAVTAGAIDAGAVTADTIAANAITADKIDAGAVTADKIQAGAVTAEKVDVAGVITAGSAQIEDVISATSVVAQNLQVHAANVTGTLTIGQLPSSVATTDDIPTESEITTITNDTISTTNVTAKNLKVDAANITGTLTVGTIPSSIARSSEIPTSTSDLYNDSGFQSYSGVTTIIGSTVTTGFVEALNISVNSAQIKDKLTADKIDVNDLIASGSIIVSGDNMSALNNDLDFQSSSDVTTIVGNTVTTGFVEALKIHVKAAQIDDALTIGQLPDTVAEKSDVPTKTSDLTNDSGFTNESGVTTIIDGRITTDYIEALNISVSSAQIKDKLTADKIDANGISATNVSISGTLTAAGGSTIGPFSVSEYSLSAIGDDGLSYNSMSKDGISCTNLSANYATISGGSITASGGSLSGMSSMSTDHATVGSDSVGVSNGINGFWYVTMSAGDSYASLSGSGASISFTGSAASLNGTWTAGSCLGTASDERVKNSILPLSTDARYDTMFDALTPAVYKYNDGTSGRTHTGYIAQDVLAAVENAGLSTTDFAGYIKAKVIDQETGEETETCYLRYEEFVALNTDQIQKLKVRVAELEKKIALLEQG